MGGGTIFMHSPSPEWASTTSALCVSAVFVHQIFRKFETFNLPFHTFLLLVPPATISYCASSTGIRWPTVSDIAFCYATYLGVLATSVVVYRLSPFHPLHRFPGPFWCRTSMFWHAVRTRDGKQMVYLRSLHHAYGDIVRIGPNHLSIRDVSLVGPILGASGIPKAATYKGATLSATNVPLIGIQDAAEHARRRRAWNRGLAPAALKGYDHIMARRVHQLVDVLARQEGAVDLGRWIGYFAYDFMSDMVFGGGSEQMRDGDKGEIWAMVDKGAEIAFHLGQLPWLGIYLGYIPGAGGPLNMLLEHGRKETAKRVARGSSTRDLFYYLNNEDLPGADPPPARHLLDDGTLAMVAGSDTTSGALASVFACLLVHPDAYAALQAEVDRFYPPGEDVCDTASHREMHYLNAVINEALRLFPPAPTSSARQVPRDAPAPVVLSPLVLPPGTHVYVPPYVLHRDARNFVRPDAFWPERWLVAAGRLSLSLALARAPPSLYPSDGVPVPVPVEGERESSAADAGAGFEFAHDEAAFGPFSHGPAGCVGRALAVHQMRVVVCALVQRFRLREGGGGGGGGGAAGNGRYEAEFRDYLVASRPGVWVVLEERG